MGEGGWVRWSRCGAYTRVADRCSLGRRKCSLLERRGRLLPFVPGQVLWRSNRSSSKARPESCRGACALRDHPGSARDHHHRAGRLDHEATEIHAAQGHRRRLVRRGYRPRRQRRAEGCAAAALMRLVVDTNIFVSAALKRVSWPGMVLRWLDAYGGLLKTGASESGAALES